ncbi:hypothetical protein A3J61_00850 [Candidatus Nomurabacteria bacterium RIFCSPHIGHO2_02_FULL_38_15]|uniref:Uncharacterized protein n=1 Tax=Candidatus Nomurabacteria bacterium RIFCSPHIGHO2_02_FULL_38_15 TaxID=1801752 RepID=A0A1F6VRU4_9BACT|nr:MAG: hypothetical protein A3J61_00850 [Candidatus Nomurabacteria bacterium RIFCSPHIGHO2_02_FULL_38_15]
MQKINIYLKNILNKKNQKLLVRKNIIEIVFLITNIKLKNTEVIFVGNKLNLKTKPIFKHKIGLHKKNILNEISNKLNLNFIDLI